MRRLLNRRVRGAILGLLVVAGPPAIGAALYLYAGSHRLLPGTTGCRYVRAISPRLDCYAGEIGRIRRSDGLRSSQRAVDRRALDDSHLAQHCHLAWHRLGEADGRRAGRSRRGDPRPQPPGAGAPCSEGYVHGFIIGYAEASGRGSDRPPVTGMCEIARERSDLVSCIHSFGHVMGRLNSHDPAAATAGCEAIGREIDSRPDDGIPAVPITRNDRFECMYGVFMEAALRDLKAAHPRRNNCDAEPLRGDALAACHTFLPARMQALGSDLDQIVQACQLAGATAARSACFYSLRAFAPGTCSQVDGAPARRECRRAKSPIDEPA